MRLCVLGWSRTIHLWELVVLIGPGALASAQGPPSRPPAWTGQGTKNEYFGTSVATAGDVNRDGYADVIIGAPGFSKGRLRENIGRAYVYQGSATGLEATAAWRADGDESDAFFGWTVGSAGDVNGDGYSDVIVGAPSYNGYGQYEGAVFVYHGSATGLGSTPNWASTAVQAASGFGASVAAGDVNGDGYFDVAVGASAFDAGQPDEGAVFVFLGSPTGLASTPSSMLEGNRVGAWFGSWVDVADVHGDGFDDLLVTEGRGGVSLYNGAQTGVDPTATWIVQSLWPDREVGGGATAGDLNADGYDDIVVAETSRFRTDSTYTFFVEQEAFAIFFGSPGGLDPRPSLLLQTPEPNKKRTLGSFATTAGDVNGDGYSDLVVGAQNFQNREAYEGAAFLYLGSPDGVRANVVWMIEGDFPGAHLGYSVGTAGDVNGDGLSDLIVGAPQGVLCCGSSYPGNAYVYHGPGPRFP